MMSKFYNNAKTALLLGAMTGLILLIAAPFGKGALIFALIFAAISNFVAFFFSDKIALHAMGAQQVGPDHELYRIVEPLARRANLPMPRRSSRSRTRWRRRSSWSRRSSRWREIRRPPIGSWCWRAATSTPPPASGR